MISEAWVIKLFWRFGEIYGSRASEIEKEVKKWQDALEGVSGEQIRQALHLCKIGVYSVSNPVLPTPENFARLCKRQPISDNKDSNCDDNKASVVVQNLPHGDHSGQDYYEKIRAEMAEEGRAIADRNVELAKMDEDNRRIQAYKKRQKEVGIKSS